VASNTIVDDYYGVKGSDSASCAPPGAPGCEMFDGAGCSSFETCGGQ